MQGRNYFYIPLRPEEKSTQNLHFLYQAFNIYISGVDKPSSHPPRLDNHMPPMAISEVTQRFYNSDLEII